MMLNLTVTDDVEVVTPNVSLLTEKYLPEHICTVKGCGKKFKNASACRFHLEKTHGNKVLPVLPLNQKKKMFACPAMACTRNASAPRKHFFKFLHDLKKHYQSVHGEKKYICQKCGKKFGWCPSKESHEAKCSELFNCLCGAFYTTIAALKTHVYRKGKGHEWINDDQQKLPNSNIKSCKSVTVPAVLYVPNMMTQKVTPVKTTSPVASYDNQRYIRILPKTNNTKNIKPVEITKHLHSYNHIEQINVLPNIIKKVKQPGDKIIQLQVNNYDILTDRHDSMSFTNQTNTNVATQCLNNSIVETSTNSTTCISPCPTSNKTKNKKRKSCETIETKPTSVYEKNLKYLASNEAQEVISDPSLMCDAMIQTEMLKASRIKYCRCKTKFCKHVKDRFLKSSVNLMNSMPITSDSFNELGSTATNLADMCTQTSVNVETFQTEDNGNSVDTSDKAKLTLPTIEVLETSESGTQSKPMDMLLPNTALQAADMETQTEEDYLNSWLNSFCDVSVPQNEHNQELKYTTSIETQTSSLMQHMVTQTEDTDTPLFHDKSIQLDDFWSSNTLFDSTNTATQTGFDENWLNIDPMQNSMSTQTTKQFDLGFTNIDFSMQTGDLLSNTNIPNELKLTSEIGSSSSLQTNVLSQTDTDADSLTKNTTETQTTISFYDLLDTSFIDEYLNVEKPKSDG